MAQRQNGGCVEPFPRYMVNGFLNFRVVRKQIEEAETLAENPAAPRRTRRLAVDYRDTMENALDILIELYQTSAQSHEDAICGQTGALCRAYKRLEPSCAELRQQAEGRVRERREAEQLGRELAPIVA